MKQLIRKYNIAGPRYTSYPTVPYWDKNGIQFEQWENTVTQSFNESNENGISLYIHLPYCESLCTFCGCHKHITKQHETETPYIDAVLKEWQLYLNLFPEKPIIKELHLGGGTPTFFSPENLKKLIEGILSTAIVPAEHEFGFEGHPNNTTKEHLETLYQLGFKRVSFGVQDYSPLVQKTINRIQPFENVKRVHQLAKEIGYTSISHDLVFGLPHQSLDNILETIRLTNTLKPDRISLYSYAHVPWIKGVGQRGFNEADLPKPEEKRALYESAKEALIEGDYHEIGMDHFALKTDGLYQAFNAKKMHRNFMGYTTNTTQLMVGLGMSSISDSWYGFAQNVKTVKEYTKLVNQGQIPIFRGHLLADEDLIMRQHILNLMCTFETSWDETFKSNEHFIPIMERLVPLMNDNLVEVEENTLRVTEIGQTFIRNICMCFDIHLHKNKPETQIFSKTI
jgi:oxygen-independent coproporphyrinogen-3 oxidase